jgi:hypothetical protein
VPCVVVPCCVAHTCGVSATQGGTIRTWDGKDDVEELMATAAEVPGPGLYPQPKSFHVRDPGSLVPRAPVPPSLYLPPRGW